MRPLVPLSYFFFFNDTATTEIYTLSLHDALPILLVAGAGWVMTTPTARFFAPAFLLGLAVLAGLCVQFQKTAQRLMRSEEHTSELQSRLHLVCRLLLEKKNNRQSLTVADLRSPFT